MMSGHELQGHTTDHSTVAEGHNHPTARKYVELAGILAAITLLEVFILYLPNLGLTVIRPALVPAFIILSIFKFLIVVGWYMHLRFDDPFFLRMFSFALIIVIGVALSFMAIFHGLYFGF